MSQSDVPTYDTNPEIAYIFYISIVIIIVVIFGFSIIGYMIYSIKDPITAQMQTTTQKIGQLSSNLTSISQQQTNMSTVPNTLATMSTDINSIKSCMCKNTYPNGTTVRTTSVNTQKSTNYNQNTPLSNMMNTRYNY